MGKRGGGWGVKVCLILRAEEEEEEEEEEEKEEEEEEEAKSRIKGGTLVQKESVCFVCLDRKEARA